MKRITPLDYNFDKVHLIGNGPSAKSFNDSDGLAICIHTPDKRCDIICSNRPEYYGYFGVPTVLVRDISLKTVFAKRLFKDKSLISTIDPCTVIRDWAVLSLTESPLELNTGHRAYLWVQHQKPKEVHMWGFDSIYQPDIYEHKSSFIETLSQRMLDKPQNWEDEIHEAIQFAPRYNSSWTSILQENTIIHE